MDDAIVAGPPLGNLTARVVGGIFALVFSALGIAFLTIGLIDQAEDADGFRTLGTILLPVGLVLAALTLVAWRRTRRATAAEQAARTRRVTATVVEAKLQEHSRIGARHPLRLAVRFDGRQQARTFYALPVGTPRPGDAIEIVYDPLDPANFAPAG
jgi:hypothetical protein